MKRFFAILMVSLFSFSSCDTAGILFGEPTAAEVQYALQKLLNSSALDALVKLKAINEEGFGGVLPEELQPVLATLKATGAISDLDKVENTMINVSEDVLNESGEIMKETIAELSFSDGVAIVLGGKDAATQVLRENMYTVVKNRYSSQLEDELVSVSPEIMNYWKIGSSAYNLLAPADEKVEGTLPDFVAERSVDLLFSSMGAAEADYRSNIERIGDSVVSKVFNYYRNNEGNTGGYGWN